MLSVKWNEWAAAATANPRHTLVWIVVFGIALRLLAFSGYAGGDDAIYLTSAMELSRGDLYVNGHWQARLGMTGPAALTFRFAEPDLLLAIAAPFAWSVLGVWLVYVLGREFYDESAPALLAALFVAVFPLHVIMASLFYPAMAIGSLASLSFLLFFRASKRDAVGMALLAGLVLGVAAAHRVTALYALLPLGLHVVWSRRLTRLHVAAFTGLLAVLVIESAAFELLVGDPLERWKVLTGTRDAASASHVTGTSVKGDGLSGDLRPGGRLFGPILSLLSNQEYGFFYYLIPVAAAFLIKKRDRASAALLLFFIAVGAYTLWGSTSPLAYLTLRPWPRYMAIVTLPAMLLLARWLTLGTYPLLSRVLVLGLVVTSFGFIYIDSSRTMRPMVAELLSYHRAHMDMPLVVRPRSYVDLFVEAGMTSPPGVSVLMTENQRTKRRTNPFKFNPAVDAVTRAELGDVTLALRLNYRGAVPENCEKFDAVQAPRRWFSAILEHLGSPGQRLAGALHPHDGYALYQCRAKG